MAVNATKLPPFGGVCLDEKIEVMSVVPVWSIYIKTFWTQENHSGKSFHQACSMSSSSSAIEIFRPKNLQKKNIFCKTKKRSWLLFCLRFPKCCAWFLETRHDEVVPEHEAVEVMKLMVWLRFYRGSFPSVQQKGSWIPNFGWSRFVINFPTLRRKSKGFQNEIHT